MIDRNEWQYLDLDDDEAECNRQIVGEVEHHLSLANNAAIITLSGLVSLEAPPHLNEPKGLVLLLLAKSAQNIRFAVTGLSLGYYSGASAILRSALEALEYVALFESDPSQIALWMRNEFSGRLRAELEKSRNEQTQAAKKALLDLENSHKVIKDGLSEFRQKANKRLHATLQGLAEEFGVDIKYLIPDEFEEAYLKTEEDFDKALELHAMLSHFGENVINKQVHPDKSEDELLMIQMNNQYDEDTLSALSMIAFYIAHRLLDLTNDIFSIRDKEFNQNYQDWHNAVRESGA